MNNKVVMDAADLIQEGKIGDARRLLAGELVEHPENADAWLALAGLVEDRERAIYYVERALEICPEDKSGQVFLSKLQMGAKPKVGRLAALEAARDTQTSWPQPLDVRRHRQTRLLMSAGLVIGVVLVALLAAAAFSLGDLGRSSAKETHEVTYRVTTASENGLHDVQVIFRDARGTPIHQQMSLPGAQWTFHIPEGREASISIENSTPTDAVTCEILVDGQVWRSAQASGRAECSGRLGAD